MPVAIHLSPTTNHQQEVNGGAALLVEYWCLQKKLMMIWMQLALRNGNGGVCTI